MKKLLSALRRTIAGKNKTGEAIHGVLDLLPIPNQIIAKIAGIGLNKQNWKEIATPRNIVALVISALIVAGIITLDQLIEFMNVFSKVIELLS